MPVPTFTSAPQPTHSVDTTNWAIVSIPATAWTPAVRTIDAETVEEEAVADCFPGGFDEVAGDWAPVPIEQAHYEITAGSEYVYKLPSESSSCCSRPPCHSLNIVVQHRTRAALLPASPSRASFTCRQPRGPTSRSTAITQSPPFTTASPFPVWETAGGM
jgi:hypothetical protein